MEMSEQNLIDFLNWLKKEGQVDLDTNSKMFVNVYLKSINLDKQGIEKVCEHEYEHVTGNLYRCLKCDWWYDSELSKP